MTDIPWYKTTAVYQIYPRSFKDTTVSGTGDLNGSIESLPYIQQLGTQVIWLTPERRTMWRLGHCDLPRYAEFCHRVDVVRDLDGLDRAADDILAGLSGR